jgi:hypothetical protein
MSNRQPNSNAVKLAGPGVQGLTHDAPLFHLDVQEEEMKEFLADPITFLAERGIGREQGIAPDGNMDVVVSSSKYEWVGDEWREKDGASAAPSGVVIYCCYSSGSHTRCHVHRQVEE